jgi:hypothetical protein
VHVGEACKRSGKKKSKKNFFPSTQLAAKAAERFEISQIIYFSAAAAFSLPCNAAIGCLGGFYE